MTAGSVSLVITVLNEHSSLRAWITSMSAMTRLPDEVVVCDGGSTDGTLEILEDWGRTASFPVRVIDAPGANISRGRNLAIAAATSEWIAVTDAGTVIDPDWLSSLLAERDDVDVVSGFYTPNGDTRFERVLATMISFREDEVDGATFLPSSRSLLLRKSAWEAVKGYPEWLDYCEDLVFDLRLKASEQRFAFAPRALVTWSARSSVRAFAKQYYRYARGDGKAGLFPKRHAIRYGVYGAGAVMSGVAIARRSPLLGLLLLIGVAAYNARYLRRVALGRTLLGPSRFIWLLAVVPLGTVGDLAKMAGYPVGRRWRRLHKPPRWQ